MYVMTSFIGLGMVILITDYNPNLMWHAWGLWWTAHIFDAIIAFLKKG